MTSPKTCSLRWCSATWLVASTRSSAVPRISRSARRPASCTRRSQLSSTSSRGKRAQHVHQLVIGRLQPWQCDAQHARHGFGQRRVIGRTGRFDQPGAAAKARSVLPTPAAPVTVTTRSGPAAGT